MCFTSDPHRYETEKKNLLGDFHPWMKDGAHFCTFLQHYNSESCRIFHHLIRPQKWSTHCNLLISIKKSLLSEGERHDVVRFLQLLFGRL